GGDAAGLSAASKFKREDPEREVIVFEKGEWVSYAHCGQPYYVKGEVDALTDLLSLSPTEIEARGIDLRRKHEVVDVNPAAGTVRVEDEDGLAFDQPYDDLLIATGGHAVADPIEGADLDGTFTIHGMDSAAALRAYLTPPAEAAVDDFETDMVDTEFVETYAAMDPPESAAIVGGGYVGVEMAEAFSAHDLDVTLFQRPDQLLPPFGEAAGERAADALREEGVTVNLGTEVEQLVGEQHVEGVVADGARIPAEVAVVGIGIQPNTTLVADAGVELGPSGAIAVDEYGCTSIENVYAAGDCTEMAHVVTGVADWVPLGLTANRAGRAIGQTVAGDPEPVGAIAGTAVVKAFEVECGRTGILDHERAREAGFDPISETVTAGSRSGYYPGNAATDVTLTADRNTGTLLGGAIAGEDRAAIRIDTVATALEGEMTVAEVERLDLAYAPPFSPVWDPVLVAAKVLNGRIES
ncbi:MAG: FAD-dependent oxidoreductase, partial [Haloarcula sp.]